MARKLKASRRARKVRRKGKTQKKKRTARMIRRGLKNSFVIKDIFPDEILLQILEYFMFNPLLASGKKRTMLWPHHNNGSFWQATESISGLLSADSNMRDTLRSIFLRVNTVPLRFKVLEEYGNREIHRKHQLYLQDALLMWPAGYLHIRSLSINSRYDIPFSYMLPDCPNLIHVRVHSLDTRYNPASRHLCKSVTLRMALDYPKPQLAGDDFMNLHANPKLCHIELLAAVSPNAVECYQKVFWEGFVEALKGFASEIAIGFTQRERQVKVEVVRLAPNGRGEILARYTADVSPLLPTTYCAR